MFTAKEIEAKTPIHTSNAVKKTATAQAKSDILLGDSGGLSMHI